jgi:hypothetical protein
VPRSADKKRAGVRGAKADSTNRPTKPPRPGLPAEDSIIAEVPFISPKGNVYRIIKTDEMDAYDEPMRPKKKRSHKPD